MRNFLKLHKNFLKHYKNINNCRAICSFNNVSIKSDYNFTNNPLLVPRLQNYSSETRIDAFGSALIDLVTFETVCSDTLESLCDYFEELIESTQHLKSSDVTFGDGVLSINFGSEFGTYVINRQTPNRQIWLSSPTSGPKRYDYVAVQKQPRSTGYWYYKHDKSTLHELLQREIPIIVKRDVDFVGLPFGNREIKL